MAQAVQVRVLSRAPTPDRILMKLLIATRNKHKLVEIRQIIDIPAIELESLLDFPGIPEVVEDGLTFEDNAVKKAVSGAKHSGLWTMADDSGLEVNALGGAPGVWSARYAGEPVSYEANNRKLLAELAGKTDRTARFRCSIALSSPTGRCEVVNGYCHGHIIHESRGQGGFGYDPLFVPDGHDQTFAEMSHEQKNVISHRANALKAATAKWSNLLASLSAGVQPGPEWR